MLTEEFGARSQFVEKVYPENESCTSFNALCWSRKVHGRRSKITESRAPHSFIGDFAHTLLIYEEAWISSPGSAKFSHIFWTDLTQHVTFQPEGGLMCQGHHRWTCAFKQFVQIAIFTEALRPIFLLPWGLILRQAIKKKIVYHLGTLVFIHWQDKQYLSSLSLSSPSSPSANIYGNPSMGKTHWPTHCWDHKNNQI